MEPPSLKTESGTRGTTRGHLPQASAALRIDHALASVRKLATRSVLTRGLSLAVLTLLGMALVSYGIDRAFRLSIGGRIVALLVYAAAFAAAAWHLVVRPIWIRWSRTLLADLVERRFPVLEDRLRSAVDFLREPAVRADSARAPAGDTAVYLKRRCAREAAEALASIDAESIIDTPRVASALVGALVALGVVGGLVAFQPGVFATWFQRQVLLADVDWPYRTLMELEGFEGGVRGVPRGDPLSIRATARGEIPDRVAIELEFRADVAHYNMTTQRGVAEGGAAVFAYEHPAVTEPFYFRLSGGDFRAVAYRVDVLERPHVDSLRITAVPPPYTGKEPEVHDGDIGEIAIPRGSRVEIRGIANKPLERAWLELAAGEVELDVTGDLGGREFVGRLAPQTGGPVTLRLTDHEAVPQDRLFRFSVHLVEDRIPVVQAQAIGLGPMITPAARMPLEIRAEDDYRVEHLLVEWKVTAQDTEPRGGEDPLPPLPEPDRSVSADEAWEIAPLEIPPGSRLDVRVGATDNNAIDDPRTGYSSILSFLIVTAERLSEDFLRREEEQRRVLERIIEEEKVVRDQVYELLGATWKEEGTLPGPAVERMLDLARTERQHAHQLLALAAAVEQILREMANNRVGEADDLERLAAAILGPLRELGETDLPELGRRLTRVREAATSAARQEEGLRLADGIEAKIEKLEAIAASMVRLEGFTEIVKNLRAIIKTQDDATSATRDSYRRDVDNLFLPEGDDGGGEDAAGPPPEKR